MWIHQPVLRLVLPILLAAFLSLSACSKKKGAGGATGAGGPPGTSSSSSSPSVPALGENQSTVTAEGDPLIFTINPCTSTSGQALAYTVASASPGFGTFSGCMDLPDSDGPSDLSCTFDPGDSGTGSATLSYRCSDGTTTSASAAAISIAVSTNEPGANLAPSPGADQAFSTPENTPVSITVTACTDPNNGDTLSYTVITPPGSGTLSGCMNLSGSDNAQDRTCTYTPAANSHGSVSFTYRCKDAAYESATHGTVSLTITLFNDAPVLSAPADQSTPMNVALSGIAFTVDEGGGADEDAQGLTVTATSSNQMLVPDGNISVAYTADGAADATGGTLGISPAAGQSGVATITLTVTDDGIPNRSATGTFTVTVAPNAAPVTGSSQGLGLSEDGASTFTLNPCTDVNGQLLSYFLVSGPASGTLSGCMDLTGSDNAQDRTCTYTPAANWSGSTSFTYKCNDGSADSASSSSVTLTVAAANDAPTIAAIADQSTPMSVALSGIAFTVDEGGGADEDAQGLTVTATSSNQTLVPDANISVAYTADGAVDATGGTLSITPANGQTGSAMITVTVTDDGSPNLSASATFTLTVSTPAAATHGGWSDVVAVGKKVSYTGANLASSSVTIKWNDFTVTGGSTASWNVYRATSSGGQDFASPLASGIEAGTRSYTDSSAAANTTYYYVVRPVVNGSAIATGESYSEIKVMTPPDNMALVHRWIANQEMCGLMGRATDPANHYRCAYTGPAGTGTHFDVGYSFFMDLQEMGCNYTPAPACGDATNGCISTGSTAPAAGVGVNGNVWYSRGDGVCYVKTGGAWRSSNYSLLTSGTPASDRGLMGSNAAYLPPLVSIAQAYAYNTCQSFGKRLPRRLEFILASAWPSSFSAVNIDTVEGGMNLGTERNCNTNQANGLTFSNLATPPDPDTLPGTLNTDSSLRSLRTGSSATASCKSRYGIQDLIGNVSEWTSDQLGTCSAAAHTCTGTTSNLDATNNHWNGYAFDGVTGPGAIGYVMGGINLANKDYGITRFVVPLGLPLKESASAGWDGLVIGTGAGEFNPAKFSSDLLDIQTDAYDGRRAATAGGYYSAPSGLGKYFGRFYVSTYYSAGGGNYQQGGFRCVLQAE